MSVVVLGSYNVDLVVNVDRLPGAGETVTGGSFAHHHGGKGANQAVAAARLGASVSFMGAVGDDEFGAQARQKLAEEGIDVSGLAVLDGTQTGVALIVVDDAGENQIAVASGANHAIDASIWDGRPGEPSSTDVFLSSLEVSTEALVAAAERYAAAGALVVVNPAPAVELPAALIGTRPILVPNEGEALTLTGESDPVTAARVLAARTGAPAIVTLGEMGAVVVQEGEFVRIAAPLVDAVDTTGAGDAFVGALAAELSVGRSLTEAVQFAVHAASLSVQVAGAREGMPSREQVERSLAERTLTDLPEHVRRNRAYWDGTASEWVKSGRRNWAQAEPHWGVWQIPESEARLLPDVDGMDVIELGCGTAYVSAWLAKRGARPVEIDNSEKQLETARSLQHEFGIDFPLIHGNAEDVPLSSGSFDLAISEYGAAIWADPYRWIPEAARLLRPGGQLIFLGNGTLFMLTVPNTDAEGPATDRLIRDYFGMNRFEWPDEDGVEFHLGYGDWIRLLRSSGFDVEELVELRPPEGATTRFPYVKAEWARRWPSEEAWKARKRA